MGYKKFVKSNFISVYKKKNFVKSKYITTKSSHVKWSITIDWVMMFIIFIHNIINDFFRQNDLELFGPMLNLLHLKQHAMVRRTNKADNLDNPFSSNIKKCFRKVSFFPQFQPIWSNVFLKSSLANLPIHKSLKQL